VAPVTAGLGSAAGEAGQVGLERLFGWPAAEPGTLTERAERAAVRGAAGEGAGQLVRLGGRVVSGAVGPTLKAAEEIAPVVAQNLPAETQIVESATPGMYRNIGRLLENPAVLAKAQLSPEGQQTLLRAWWQQNASKGAGTLVNAWDRLAATPGAQEALAGDQHEAVSTLVNSLRRSAAPMTWKGAVGGGVSAVPLSLAGHPYLATGLSYGSQAASRYAPRMFLSPTMSPWLARLPRAARVAAPGASLLLRGGGQAGAAEFLP
jgi:hypothetical protein